ncbi:2'-5' RNA ligase [Kibdelosporangium sp. 4NS15]|uniref:2'-5' RNA ligase n=1 Tax=Kibdelosporangium persicum TaxID=2698649 RepID=A0ABX2F4Q7_9PSEU|nr:2'-5' RNA ligase family protein [Kibdelosporangium persicum]NRN66168.1 2'-5' RNA ligase [Kibdelosporangium persicum]
MAHTVAVFFDDEAERAVRALWRRLDQAGVPSLAKHPNGRWAPRVTFAAAKQIPRRTRDLLKDELRTLAIPNLWLSNLGTFPSTENVLMLGAVVDAELLAVHSAVHDVLAGRVQSPQAYWLPGSWTPHCTLTQGVEHHQLVEGFAALHPVDRIEARVEHVAIVDTQTAEVEIIK